MIGLWDAMKGIFVANLDFRSNGPDPVARLLQFPAASGHAVDTFEKVFVFEENGRHWRSAHLNKFCLEDSLTVER